MDWKKLQEFNDNVERMRRAHERYKKGGGGCAVIIGMMSAIIGVLALIVKMI